LCRLHATVRVTKPRRLLWSINVARMGNIRNEYRILARDTFAKRPLGGPRRNKRIIRY
jgi:hypothetical protein